MIGLHLSQYTLSSSLPQMFTIYGVDKESVEVSIMLQENCIYSTHLYRNSDNSCFFYEFRQIIEEYMASKGITLASLEIIVDDGNGLEQYNGVYIIFCRYKNTEFDDEDFLHKRFLTTRSYFTLPSCQLMMLSFFSTEEENNKAYFDCTFQSDRGVMSVTVRQTVYKYDRPYVYSLLVSVDYLKELADDEMGDDCGKLLSFTARMGERSLHVFIQDDEPCKHLSFRNCFNVWEELFVFGITTQKTDFSRKEAIVMGTSSFYDKSVSRKYDVSTVPLSLEEARWMNEFLESDEVVMEVSNDYLAEPVLISDITSEISDSAKEQVIIKFSYRFKDNSNWLNI